MDTIAFVMKPYTPIELRRRIEKTGCVVLIPGMATMGMRIAVVLLTYDIHEPERSLEAQAAVEWFDCQVLTRLVPGGIVVDGEIVPDMFGGAL